MYRLESAATCLSTIHNMSNLLRRSTYQSDTGISIDVPKIVTSVLVAPAIYAASYTSLRVSSTRSTLLVRPYSHTIILRSFGMRFKLMTPLTLRSLSRHPLAKNAAVSSPLELSSGSSLQRPSEHLPCFPYQRPSSNISFKSF